jgi:hypothetical protein
MYKITIEKIEQKEVEKREYSVIWIKEWTKDEQEWGYINIPNIKEVKTEIYSQSIENKDFNIKDVIDAFNK